MGGPHVACRFYEMPLSHVSVTYLCPCRMSDLRKALSHVTIFMEALSHVKCRISNLRNGPVDFRGQGP